jgi:hypothetical protein
MALPWIYPSQAAYKVNTREQLELTIYFSSFVDHLNQDITQNAPEAEDDGEQGADNLLWSSDHMSWRQHHPFLMSPFTTFT